MGLIVYDLKLMVAKRHDSRKGVFVVLPPEFSPGFTSTQMARKDDNKISVNIISLGQTDFGNMQEGGQ